MFIATTSHPAQTLKPSLPPTFVVPNFHPASCGWLANWSVERNYCANSYLDHLDRVRDGANYEFVLSECNNMIAILNFTPDRFAELKQRVKEGRVELPNAFFLEPTINLSGGEALAKMGIEGLRWQEKMLGVRPRYCWAIDVCGTHDQMPQLCQLLGLDALVYTRCSRGGKTAFWSDSPDGSRILTLVPGHYSDFAAVMGATNKLTKSNLEAVERAIANKTKITPAGAPVLFLGGKGDYSLAPPRRELPTEFLEQWKVYRPNVPVRFTTLSKYVDALQPAKLNLPVVRAGTSYTFDSFWIENSRVKTAYRHAEHSLQTAEMLATIASLKSDYEYPAQTFYHAWLQMLLNMDRNTLWGSAGGMVFEHETSWDAKDRFEWVEKHSVTISKNAIKDLITKNDDGDFVSYFNPLNWQRSDAPDLLPCGFGPSKTRRRSCFHGSLEDIKKETKTFDLSQPIETKFYSARIDLVTGALISLKVKPSGREMLGGPANVLVLEKWSGHGDPGDFCDPRSKRTRITNFGEYKLNVSATQRRDEILVAAYDESSKYTREIVFNTVHPRIEFHTRICDLPDRSVLVAEFPLAETPAEIRRGIPFGFSRDDNHVQGIVPAVRWSDYSTPGKGGVALLDEGLSGREINSNVPVIYLYNATNKYYGYPNAWLSGKGEHWFSYALVAHEADWNQARIPQMAWEYNCPPVYAHFNAKPESFLKTSDNVIVEAMRRDGADIELRLVECVGVAGNAEVTLNLPHESAALTDLVGGHAQKLGGGPTYKFPVRPQQIVTMRFRTAKPVAEIKPLTEWEELVPEKKRPALHEYLKDKKGHPPRGS